MVPKRLRRFLSLIRRSRIISAIFRMRRSKDDWGLERRKRLMESGSS